MPSARVKVSCNRIQDLLHPFNDGGFHLHATVLNELEALLKVGLLLADELVEGEVGDGESACRNGVGHRFSRLRFGRAVVEAGSAGGLFLSQRHQLVVDRTESVELGFLVVVVVKGSLVKHTHQKVFKGAVLLLVDLDGLSGGGGHRVVSLVSLHIR